MKLNLYDVLLEPSVTEKITRQQKVLPRYAFRVHPRANKPQIRSAVEKIYNVHVVKIRTLNVAGKWRRVRFQPGRTPDWKKAVVTLKKGEAIDITA